MTNTKKKQSSVKEETEEKDKEWILNLYKFMCQEGLVDLGLEESGCRISIKRYRKNNGNLDVPVDPRQYHQHAPAAVAERSGEKASAAPAENALYITAPLVGTFYRASSPTADPYVKQGEKVESGRVLCLVEAMKVMNEIKAEKNCRIKDILVENGKQVSAGQNLFEIELT